MLFWQTTRFAIDLARPQVMGIVNVTPDSFSDGGAHASTQAAAALKERGAWFLFLPAYSPDLNPIEMAFAKLKAHPCALPAPAPTRRSGVQSATSAHCSSRASVGASSDAQAMLPIKGTML